MHDKYINQLLDAFNEDSKEMIEKLTQNLDSIVLVKFLEVANSEHRRKFIEGYLKGSILTELSPEIKIDTLEIIGITKYAKLIENLSVEDALVAIQDLDENTQEEILTLLPENEAKKILHELLSYPEESAGRLIHKDFIVISENWSVSQAVEFLRMRKNIPEKQNQIFVINKKLEPVGRVEFSDILFSKKDTQVTQIMNTKLYPVTTDLDQEAVANIFRQYDLLSTAVVNDVGQIVGLVSADDIVEVVTKEAEEDILHLGKVSSTDISAKFIKTISNRLPWLFITFLAINFTSLVVGLFEKALLSSVELAILMPIIAAMGGNAGVQASTIAVRAIATQKLTHVNTSRLIIKEFFLGLVNGIIVSVFAVLIIMLRFHNFKIEMIFAISIILVFSAATFFGSAIPILLNRFGFDPALSASVITTAITDMLGFSILLGVASLLLS